jgi:Protein of unknown function (DUF3592)
MDTELIILLISSGFLIVGTILWQKGNHLLTNGKVADAVIFKNNHSTSRSGRGTYYPVVRFLTDKQEWITQELSIGYSPAKEEGTKLQVIYDPEDPTKVEINSTLQLEILPRLFVALGIGGLIFGTLEYLNIIELISN